VSIFANQLPPPSLVDLVPKIAPTAVFFIHATKGAGGEDNNPDYFDAAGPPQADLEDRDLAHARSHRLPAAI
jgi:hypothetical protein